MSPFTKTSTRKKKKQDCNHSVFFRQTNDTNFRSEEQSICEGTLTEKECLAALKTMESNKMPGTDGLPAEFYKVFWKDISSFLISALHYSFESVRLSISQRRNAIKLIPKKGCGVIIYQKLAPNNSLKYRYKIAAKSHSKPSKISTSKPTIRQAP